MMREAGPQEWVHEEIRHLAEIYYSEWLLLLLKFCFTTSCHFVE